MALYITFFLYFCIVFFIGFRAYRATLSHEDYVLGGRRLNSLITALGVGASDMSGWLMIGMPGAIYAFGMDHIWTPVGLIIGAYLNWKLVAYRLRVFTFEANNSLTIPSYLEHRFKDETKSLRLLTSLIVIIFFTVYSSAGFVSAGILFSSSFGITYHTALIIGATLLVLYASIGGFLAVNWVDVFQGGLMLLALIVLPLYIMYLLNYTDPNLLSIAHLKANYGTQFSSSYFNFIPQGSNLAVSIALASTLSWGLGYFGQPHILVRFMASESKNSIRSARKICMSWMILALTGSVAVGLLAKIFYLNSPLADPEQAFFQLVQDNINEWVAGWFIAAVLSCIMSTVAAQLILSASALAEDIYHARINPYATDRKLLWVGRSTVILVASLAIMFAWNKESSVLDLVGHAWAGLGASFGPVVLMSLFWRRMTKQGAMCGMIMGTLTIILWIIARHLWYIPALDTTSWLQLYEMIPAFVINFMTIIVVSLLDNKPDPEIEELYNRSHKLCIES